MLPFTGGGYALRTPSLCQCYSLMPVSSCVSTCLSPWVNYGSVLVAVLFAVANLIEGEGKDPFGLWLLGIQSTLAVVHDLGLCHERQELVVCLWCYWSRRIDKTKCRAGPYPHSLSLAASIWALHPQSSARRSNSTLCTGETPVLGVSPKFQQNTCHRDRLWFTFKHFDIKSLISGHCYSSII